MGRRITNSQIKFKTLMLSSSLCGNSDAHIRVKETIEIVGAGAKEDAKHTGKRNKQTTFKNCTPFTDCINEIYDTQIGNAKYRYCNADV